MDPYQYGYGGYMSEDYQPPYGQYDAMWQPGNAAYLPTWEEQFLEHDGFEVEQQGVNGMRIDRSGQPTWEEYLFEHGGLGLEEQTSNGMMVDPGLELTNIHDQAFPGNHDLAYPEAEGLQPRAFAQSDLYEPQGLGIGAFGDAFPNQGYGYVPGSDHDVGLPFAGYGNGALAMEGSLEGNIEGDLFGPRDRALFSNALDEQSNVQPRMNPADPRRLGRFNAGRMPERYTREQFLEGQIPMDTAWQRDFQREVPLRADDRQLLDNGPVFEVPNALDEDQIGRHVRFG